MGGLQVLGEVDLNETPAKASSGPTVLGEVDLPAPPAGSTAVNWSEYSEPSAQAPVDWGAYAGSKPESSAAIDRTSRLASSPELPAARNRLDIGGPHQGTATQEVERQGKPSLVLAQTRKAAPLAVPPANPEQITPVGRPALGLPVAPWAGVVKEAPPVPLPSGRFTRPATTPAEAAGDLREVELYKTPYRGVQQMEKGVGTLFPPGRQAPPGLSATEALNWHNAHPDPYPSGSEMLGAGTDIMAGAGKAATPAMIVGAAAAPVAAIGAGLAATGASYGVGKLADLAHAKPETKAFFQELAQWGGGLLGAKAGAVLDALPAAAREGALTDLLWKRGYAEDNNGQPIHIETRPQAQAVAREMIRQNPKGAIGSLVESFQAKRATGGVNAREDMGVAPPAPPQSQLTGSTDPASVMASANARNVQAAKQSAGIPEPPPPAPPPPPGPDFGPGLTQANVDGMVGLIKTASEAERPQVLLHAHDLFTKWALTRGTGVGPDGKIFTVKNLEQATKLSAGWINDEVANQDKLAAEQQKQSEKKGPSIAEGITASRARAKQARKLQVLGEVDLPSAQGNAEQRAGAENVAASPASGPTVLGEVDLPAPPAGSTAVNWSEYSEPSAEAPKLTVLGEEHLIKKGQQVVLPGGEQGEVKYIDDTRARVEIANAGANGGSKRVSIPPGKLKAVEEQSVSATNGRGGGEVSANAPARGPGSRADVAGKTGSDLAAENKTKAGRTVAVPPSAASPAEPGNIIFARHGATKLDQAGSNETVAGWSAEPLDDRGVAAANKMAASLKDSGVTHIISSDLPRAKQTAEIVGKELGLPVKTDDRLRPQHVPETEGLKIDQAKKIWDYYEQHPDEKPKGGESWNQFTTRQAEALDEVESLAKTGKPLVMSHSRNLESALGKKPEPGGMITKALEAKEKIVAPASKPESKIEASKEHEQPKPIAARAKALG